MKQFVGIGVLLLVNIVLIGYSCFALTLQFGLIVLPLGLPKGLLMASDLTYKSLWYILGANLLVGILNYLILRKLVLSYARTITVIVYVVALAFELASLASARHNFIYFQEKNTTLRHYLKRSEIVEAVVLPEADTLRTEKLHVFLDRLEKARYKPGIWKYAGRKKIILVRTTHAIDTLLLGKYMAGPYEGKYFSWMEN